MDQVQIPEALVADIDAGRAVAFVGAGFAAPAVPGWADLLRQVADRADLDPGQRHWVAELLDAKTSRDLEAVAQILQDVMGARFAPAVAAVMHKDSTPHAIEERLRLLAGIPFDAIVTTNFDPSLDGTPPGREAYRAALRRPANRWWDPRYWDTSTGAVGAPVIKLHGQVTMHGHVAADDADLIITQQDYRRRVYGSVGHLTFLRALFTTRTVLFMGVSFTDAYLNELRSEVLALFDHRKGDPPIAYAILDDVGEAQAHHLRVHEGIEVLHVDSRGGTDFGDFDAHLRALHDVTSPLAVLGRALVGRTVLWLDAQPDNNLHGMRVLATAAARAGGDAELVPLRTPDAALAWVATPGHHADLIITQWGHGRGRSGAAVGEELLRALRRGDLRVPVIVFASGEEMAQNRPLAMGLGATDYVADWGLLFREVVRVLGPRD